MTSTSTFAERVDDLHNASAVSTTAAAPWLASDQLRLVLGVMAVFCATTATLMSLWAFLPATLGYESTAIVSDSMAPRVERGDVVVFSEAGEDPLGPGAVIRFFGEGQDQAVVHRVKDIDARASVYVTQGDANATVDSDLVPFSAVEGVGTLLVPLVGWPLVWVHDGNWMALVLFALGAAAVIWLAQGVLGSAFATPQAEGLGPLRSRLLRDDSDSGTGLLPNDLRNRLGLVG